MKIVRLIMYRLLSRWMFLKVETDEGVTGQGEPATEGHARAVEAAMHGLSHHLIGQDPSRINDLWQAIYRAGFYRSGPTLMSTAAGIDQALQDVKDKVLGVPVYELFGGLARDKMRIYSWVDGDRPADVIAGMRALQAVGSDHLKLNSCGEVGITDTPHTMDAAVAKVAEIRSVPGNTVESRFDFHGRVSTPMAKVLIKELESYRLLFIEESVLAEQAETYTRLAAYIHLSIAAGERMFSRFGSKYVLEADGVPILQPGLSHVGGITECAGIAIMTKVYDMALVPYCSFDPIVPAVCLYVDFISWSATLQEQSMGIHYNKNVELLGCV